MKSNEAQSALLHQCKLLPEELHDPLVKFGTAVGLLPIDSDLNGTTLRSIDEGFMTDL